MPPWPVDPGRQIPWAKQPQYTARLLSLVAALDRRSDQHAVFAPAPRKGRIIAQITDQLFSTEPDYDPDRVEKQRASVSRRINQSVHPCPPPLARTVHSPPFRRAGSAATTPATSTPSSMTRTRSRPPSVRSAPAARSLSLSRGIDLSCGSVADIKRYNPNWDLIRSILHDHPDFPHWDPDEPEQFLEQQQELDGPLGRAHMQGARARIHTHMRRRRS